jgi:hypothetical protein
MRFILARIKVNHRKHPDVFFEGKLAIVNAPDVPFGHVSPWFGRSQSHADLTA